MHARNRSPPTAVASLPRTFHVSALQNLSPLPWQVWALPFVASAQSAILRLERLLINSSATFALPPDMCGAAPCGMLLDGLSLLPYAPQLPRPAGPVNYTCPVGSAGARFVKGAVLQNQPSTDLAGMISAWFGSPKAWLQPITARYVVVRAAPGVASVPYVTFSEIAVTVEGAPDLTRANVALYKPVTASSSLPLSPGDTSAPFLSPHLAVDGLAGVAAETSNMLGVSTAPAGVDGTPGGPSVTVDLLARVPVTMIRLTPRSFTCCLGSAEGLTIELWDDPLDQQGLGAGNVSSRQRVAAWVLPNGTAVNGWSDYHALNAGFCLPQDGNLIANGGFEGTSGGPIAPGDEPLDFGWRVLSGSVDMNSIVSPFAGLRSLDLDGDKPGAVAQDVTGMQPARRYRLDWRDAGNWASSTCGNFPDNVPSRSYHIGQFLNSIDGAGRGTQGTITTNKAAGWSEAAPGWQSRSRLVTAPPSGSFTIAFASLSAFPGQSCGMLIDAVSLQPASSASAAPGATFTSLEEASSIDRIDYQFADFSARLPDGDLAWAVPSAATARTMPNATRSGARLLAANGPSAGALWHRGLVDVRRSFTASFLVTIDAADPGAVGGGLTFTLQRSAQELEAIGDPGPGLGADRLVPSVSVLLPDANGKRRLSITTTGNVTTPLCVSPADQSEWSAPYQYQRYDVTVHYAAHAQTLLARVVDSGDSSKQHYVACKLPLAAAGGPGLADLMLDTYALVGLTVSSGR